MKIAYLINHQIWRNDGVTKKIAVQSDAWRANGHEVEVFCITRKVDDSILIARQYHLGHPAIGRLLVDQKLVHDIEEYKPDIVYLRYDLWSATIDRVIARYKTVAELNTLDVEEYRLLLIKERSVKAFFRYLAYIALRSRLFRRFSGIVGVTHEIVAASSIARFSLPNVVVPNGISFTKYATMSREGRDDDPVRLFFIATPGQPWHGVDFIVDLAHGLPDFEFHIVGMTGKSDAKNIIWHGYLNQVEYSNILARCHVCIGSLALFRNGMQEACPLKVREYLAYGFPVIVGYHDTAFMNAPLPDFILKVDLEKEGATESIIYAVREFCVRLKNRVVLSGELSMVDADRLECKRISFFNDISGAYYP
jgi:hypothetical protein